MSHKTKILCTVLMITLLVSMLASCGGNAQPSTAPSAQPTSSSEPSTSPSEQPTDEVESLKLPLVDEPATLSVWRLWLPTIPVEDANELACYPVIEKMTNVHIEWTLASLFSVAETFNLMITSGEYPDIVHELAIGYPGGPDAAINDEV